MDAPASYIFMPTSVLDPYVEQIQALVALYPDLSAVRIQEESSRGPQGYSGSITILRRYLRRIRPARGRPGSKPGDKWVRERVIPLPPRCREGVNSPYLPACPFRAPGDPIAIAPTGGGVGPLPTSERAASRSSTTAPSDGNDAAGAARCQRDFCA